ncbi:MAG: hypothetical protein LBG78_09845, partial [Azoarcus sp.]|nr:hypothetical protein [Azoarcus sp.]
VFIFMSLLEAGRRYISRRGGFQTRPLPGTANTCFGLATVWAGLKPAPTVALLRAARRREL